MNTEIFNSKFTNQETIDWVKETTTEISSDLGVGGGGIEFDQRRIATTIEYVKKYDLFEGALVEIGSLDYVASQVLWRHFPTAAPKGTKGDLCTQPLAFESDSIDSLICLEVIEHLADKPYHQATTLKGLFYFLEEVYRVLKVGGKALITTPNAASLWTIQRALLQQPPMLYEWHFREFTVNEIEQIMESVGFKITTITTEYVWHLWDFKPIHQLITQEGYSLKNRGDDIFIVVEKLNKKVKKEHNLQLPI